MNKITFKCALDKVKEICNSLAAGDATVLETFVDFEAVYSNTNNELSYILTVENEDPEIILFLKLKFGEYEYTYGNDTSR